MFLSWISQVVPYVLPGLIELVPIFRVQLGLAEGFESVEAFNENTLVRTTEKRITATIEDIHDVLIIQY